MTEKPTCVSLLLCDQVLDDKRSNNKSFIGCFNAVFAQTLPCTHPRLCVVVSVSGLIGVHELMVTIKSPSDQKLFEAKAPADVPDPLLVFDVVFEILGMPFNETGTYFVDAFCDDSHIGTRRFQIMLPSA